LGKLLDRISENHLEINKKCVFVKKECEFLMYSVNNLNVHALHSSLGVFLYFRRLVFSFARKARSLTDLLTECV